MKNLHRSVMSQTVLDFLNIQPGKWYADATLGDGGHTLQILQKGGKVIAIDQDKKAITRAHKRLSTSCPTLKISLKRSSTQVDCILVHANFANLKEILTKHKISSLSGIIFDLGLSTHQILDPDRGFSFQSDSPLDMRMNQDLGATAADLANALSQKELAHLLQELGGESRAKAIAKKIVEHRPITTTKQLANLVSSVKKTRGKTHPATQTFQALRMAVNLERDSLKKALPSALKILAPQARLVVISFHSGEDRIVKHFFKSAQAAGKLSILTKKPLLPSELEINKNPRARSAKLRAAAKS